MRPDPRRILLLITDLEIGGTPTVVRELAIRLREPGRVEVEVACLSRWGPVADRLESAGVAVTPLNARGIGDFPVALLRLARLVCRGRFDTVFSFLVHANAMAAAALPFCPGVRLIQSVQTTQPDPRWHWWLQRLVHVAADAIVVPSSSAAGSAEGWGGAPREIIHVIPNAVDSRGSGASDVWAADPRPYPVGFIGRLDPVKRVPDLLRAVKLLGDTVHLHVYGEGADRPRIESAVRDLGIASRVTMHGAVPGPGAALRRIGLLVLPSQAEGFGLVLIEAMAARVPVVATDVPGIRDVVRHGRTGLLVPPARPAELAEAIRRVVGDRVLRRRLVESAGREVERCYGWERVLAQYHRALRV